MIVKNVLILIYVMNIPVKWNNVQPQENMMKVKAGGHHAGGCTLPEIRSCSESVKQEYR